MKFDMISAMQMMWENFGIRGEILLTQNKEHLKIQLRVYRFGEFHSHEMEIPKDRIESDDFVRPMNEFFQEGIREIKELIKIKEKKKEEETYEKRLTKQMEDSNTIFTAISTSGARDFKEAEKMIVMGYVMDMTFSRAGISHALKRLEKFYEEKEDGKNGD